MSRLFGVVVIVALALWGADVIDGRFVWAPLMGLAIWRVGFASFRSLAAGGAHVPEGPPTPIDVSAERVTYWCGGCGAELLLLVRGSNASPRHCGEGMQERNEVRRSH